MPVSSCWTLLPGVLDRRSRGQTVILLIVFASAVAMILTGAVYWLHPEPAGRAEQSTGASQTNVQAAQPTPTAAVAPAGAESAAGTASAGYAQGVQGHGTTQPPVLSPEQLQQQQERMQRANPAGPRTPIEPGSPVAPAAPSVPPSVPSIPGPAMGPRFGPWVLGTWPPALSEEGSSNDAQVVCNHDLGGLWSVAGRQVSPNVWYYSTQIEIQQFRDRVAIDQPSDNLRYFGVCRGDRLELDMYLGSQFVGAESGVVGSARAQVRWASFTASGSETWYR